MQRIVFAFAVVAMTVGAPWSVLAGDREDRATAEQIAALIRDSGALQNYSLGVKYKNGTVWLSGRVTSEDQMQSALQVVSDIEGIEQIVNNLEVGGRSKVKQASANMRSTAKQAGGPAAAAAARGGVAPAGYHAMKHAARHAPPVTGYVGGAAGCPPAYDQPHLPNYAWPSYAASPNYAALTYPKQYSPTAFPFIGPFYPYPQVPLGWRKVALEWDDGWWFLDFYDRSHH
jgi:hypothetical protein